MHTEFNYHKLYKNHGTGFYPLDATVAITHIAINVLVKRKTTLQQINETLNQTRLLNPYITNNQTLQSIKDEYRNLDNLFANYFRQIDENAETRDLSTEEKIKYTWECIRPEFHKQRYFPERIVALEKDILIGAKIILTLYYRLNPVYPPKNEVHIYNIHLNLNIQYDTPKETRVKKANLKASSLKDCFRSDSSYETFLNILRENNYINNKNEISMGKKHLSGLLKHLRNNAIIKNDIKNTDLVRTLRKDFDYDISPATFTNPYYPEKEGFKKLYNQFDKEFNLNSKI